MKSLFLLTTIFGTILFSTSIQTDISTYYESDDFHNSTIKDKGYAVGLIGSLKDKNSFYKLGYEYEYTQNIPRFKAKNGNFKIHKLYSKYAYNFNKNWNFNINYINVLDDNIAPTSHVSVYGAGLGYNFNKQFSINFTQFFSDYKIFDAYQSDIKLIYKTKISDTKVKLQSITKIINLKDYESNSYSKKADSSYFTSGVKAGILYNSYLIGIGAYFGERAFAVMDDGFKVQHHALSFSETYAVVLGKTFNNLNVKLQYIYLGATELPSQTDITVDIVRLVGSYRF